MHDNQQPDAPTIWSVYNGHVDYENNLPESPYQPIEVVEEESNHAKSFYDRTHHTAQLDNYHR